MKYIRDYETVLNAQSNYDFATHFQTVHVTFKNVNVKLFDQKLSDNREK